MGLVFLDLDSWTSTALQAGARPSGLDVALLALAGAQVVIYAIGLAVIYWQLWQMKKYGQQRDRAIDAWAASLRETTRELEERLRRQPLPSN